MKKVLIFVLLSLFITSFSRGDGMSKIKLPKTIDLPDVKISFFYDNDNRIVKITYLEDGKTFTFDYVYTETSILETGTADYKTYLSPPCLYEWKKDKNEVRTEDKVFKIDDKQRITTHYDYKYTYDSIGNRTKTVYHSISSLINTDYTYDTKKGIFSGIVAPHWFLSNVDLGHFSGSYFVVNNLLQDIQITDQQRKWIDTYTYKYDDDGYPIEFIFQGSDYLDSIPTKVTITYYE